jgi:mannose-6-phosphate isomerase-like protein (cupin superfamily)
MMWSARRRVVTGTRGQHSAAHDDSLIEPVMVSALPGYAWHRIWSLDRPPADPPDSLAGDGRGHFPPPGGVRFTIYTVPPRRPGQATTLTAAAESELERSLPGRSSYLESDQDGMHRTPTLDLICILAGEIWLELDDGDVHLREGDCVVQNGTRHAWRNRNDSPCTMAIVLIGADEAKA